MSPKLSSLAVEEAGEETNRYEARGSEPELYAINTRSRIRSSASQFTTGHEDVVCVGGQFTISF